MVVINSAITNLANMSRIVNLSPQVLSNLKSEKRSDTYKFPAEVYENMYNTNELIAFLEQVGQIPKGEYCYIPLIADDNRCVISVVGEARTGKDYIASLFTYDPKKFIDLWCSGGGDKTKAVEKLYVVPETENFVLFHIPLDEKAQKKLSNDDIEKAKTMSYPHKHNLDVDSDEYEKLKENIMFYESLCEKFMENGKISEDIWIEIRMRPSVLSKKIMKRLNRKTMLIHIYPGQSGNVKIGSYVQSDLFVTTLADQNRQWAMDSLQSIAQNIKPYCADSKLIILYQGRGTIMNERKYNEAQARVEENFKDFAPMLKEVRSSDSIIESNISFLRMEDSVMLAPNMDIVDPKESGYVFEEFNKRIEDRICTLLEENDYTDELKSICLDKEQRKFAMGVLNGLPIQMKQGNFVMAFNKGNRVYSYDDYNCSYIATIKMCDQRKKVYDYFLTFNKNDYNEEWQQKIIQLLYKIISTAIRDDEGLGIGTQSREIQPPVTMRTEESLVAEKIKYLNTNNCLNSETYKEALKEIGIESKSWENVYIQWDDKLKQKMLNRVDVICEIIKGYGNDLNQVIEYRHILSSRLLAEVDLMIKAFGLTKDEAISNIKSRIKS